MPAVDRAAPLQFLRTAFQPEDWVAVFLKSYATGRVSQRVGPLSWVMHNASRRGYDSEMPSASIYMLP
jgi:hypothetical protein